MEIAYVDRPHLARVLRALSRLARGGRWHIRAGRRAEDHTNHRYGAPEIEGGVVDCARNGPEILTAEPRLAARAGRGWSRGLQTRDLGAYEGAASLNCR